MSVELSFQPNPLDAYNQYTYYFKLYILGAGNSPVVLAETGGSGTDTNIPYAIDDVEIDSVVSPSQATFTGLATSFKFTVKEPRGASFLDHVAKQASLANVNNFTKMVFYLELSFKARDENGLPTKANTDREQRFVYPMTITNCETKVTSSGSVYEFSAVRIDDLGYSDQHGVVHQSVSVAAETFGEFLQKFQSSLFEKEVNRLGKHVSVPDVYEFNIVKTKDDPDLSKYRIRAVDKNQEQPQKNANYTSKDNDKKTEIHLGAKQDILRCIDFVLASTLELKEKFSKLSGGEYDKNRARFEDFIKQFYRVCCEVEYTVFDPLRNDWAKKFTYTIIPYEFSSVIVNPKELTSDVKTNETRIKSLNEKQTLVKRYDYIYTGRNDQILDFDLNLNFAWFMPVPPNDGMYTYGSTDIGHRIKKYTNEKSSELRKKLKAEANKKLSVDDLSEIRDRVLSSLPQKNFETDSNMVSQDDKNHSHSTNSYGVENTLDEGKNVLSSYYTQALRTGAGELINIELDIKGDPYWLPGSAGSYCSTDVSSKVANHLKNEILFLFTAKTPAIFEDGISAFQRSGILSGVYATRQITHSFSNGKFVQQLQAFRIHTIDITKIKKL